MIPSNVTVYKIDLSDEFNVEQEVVPSAFHLGERAGQGVIPFFSSKGVLPPF